jgi:hypothetical protein
VVTIEVARKQADRVAAAATIVQAEVATVGPRNATTCSANLRIGREADNRANASKTFSGAAVTDWVVVVDAGAAAAVDVVVKRSQFRWMHLRFQMTPSHA